MDCTSREILKDIIIFIIIVYFITIIILILESIVLLFMDCSSWGILKEILFQQLRMLSLTNKSISSTFRAINKSPWNNAKKSYPFRTINKPWNNAQKSYPFQAMYKSPWNNAKKSNCKNIAQFLGVEMLQWHSSGHRLKVLVKLLQ